jgi:NADH:ubiquinone oxidoreductase subunit H
MSDFITQFGVLGGLGMAVLQILGFTIVLLISLAFLLLMDRKVWAAVQMRKGPNVVGAFGLCNPSPISSNSSSRKSSFRPASIARCI